MVFSNGAYETSCEIAAGVVDMRAAAPNDSQSKSESESAITGTLKLTYFLKNNNEDIKITNVSGSWSQTYSDIGIEIQELEVQVLNGAVWGGKNEYYSPTDWVFSFDTGWDYVQLYPSVPEAGTGPRAFSDCEWRIIGMGFTWYKFTVALYLDFTW